MSFLASALPGLRDLRAPLASGVLLLLSAWQLIGRREDISLTLVPGTPSARAWDFAGELGQLSALAFMAYVVGIMWVSLVLSGFAGMFKSISSPVRTELDAWMVRQGLPAETSEAVLSDPESLRTELLMKSEPVFGELDRRRAEGEFRVSIAGPFCFAAAAVATERIDGSLGRLVGLGVLSGVLAYLLATGLMRMRSALDDLVRQVTAGRIDAPVVTEAKSAAERTSPKATIASVPTIGPM